MKIVLIYIIIIIINNNNNNKINCNRIKENIYLVIECYMKNKMEILMKLITLITLLYKKPRL